MPADIQRYSKRNAGHLKNGTESGASFTPSHRLRVCQRAPASQAFWSVLEGRTTQDRGSTRRRQSTPRSRCRRSASAILQARMGCLTRATSPASGAKTVSRLFSFLESLTANNDEGFRRHGVFFRSIVRALAGSGATAAWRSLSLISRRTFACGSRRGTANPCVGDQAAVILCIIFSARCLNTRSTCSTAIECFALALRLRARALVLPSNIKYKVTQGEAGVCSGVYVVVAADVADNHWIGNEEPRNI